MINKRYALGKVLSVGSSSEGNAYYIEIHRKGYPTPFGLLIEAGFPYNELSRRLLNYGVSMRNVNAVLVTHEHHDHSLAVKELVERGKKVYAPLSVFKHWGLEDKVTSRNIFEVGKTKLIADGIDVVAFKVEHDVETVGFIITIRGDWGEHRIFFATDTSYIRYNFFKYTFETIMIEANNTRRVLYYAIKNAKENGDKWGEIHFDRVLRTHFLIENTIKTLIGSKSNAGFNLSKTDNIYLLHSSASSNTNHMEIKMMLVNALKESKLFRMEKHGEKVYKLPHVHIFLKNGEIM